MEDKVIAYKGMNSKMQCRGMQYEVGKEFSVDGDIECCGNGLHACERPLDVFGYYAPGTGARYFRVEQSGEMVCDGTDSKVASRKMRVDAEIGILGLVKAHIDYVKAHATTGHTNPKRAIAGDDSTATAGDLGAATAGNRGAATAGRCGTATVGYDGAATAGDSGTATAGCGSAATAGDDGTATAGCDGAATVGDRGTATVGKLGVATAGDYGTATAGYKGAATVGKGGKATVGDDGTATAGNYGTATAGNRGTATAGNRGTATSRGRASVDVNGIACSRSNAPMARGGLGAVLVLVEEQSNNYNIAHWKAVEVDGQTVKAYTWYRLKNGKLMEAGDDE